MWSMKAKPVTLKATKALANEFVEMEPAPHDRPLSERRLMVYEKMFKAGGFRPVTWAKCHCEETGTTYRVNGKHTSVLLSGLDEIPPFYVVVEEYEAETLEDVAKLYATFDSRSMVRTTADINRSFAAAIPEIADISSRLINVLVGGISYTRWLDHYGSIPPAERAEQLLDCVDFCLWTNGIFNGSEHLHRHMARVPVVGAMKLTFDKSKKDSTTFWTAVRDETGTTPTLPDRKLARFLVTSSLQGKQVPGILRNRNVSAREFYVKSIHAWNAYRNNKQTDLKYYANVDIPKVS
jgi:hypothetical protein